MATIVTKVLCCKDCNRIMIVSLKFYESLDDVKKFKCLKCDDKKEFKIY